MKETIQTVSLHVLFCLISFFSGCAARRAVLLRLQGKRADALTWRYAGIASGVTIFFHMGVGSDLAWLAWMPAAITTASGTLVGHLRDEMSTSSLQDTSQSAESAETAEKHSP